MPICCQSIDNARLLDIDFADISIYLWFAAGAIRLKKSEAIAPLICC
ncbi:MAG: hypothetical protein WBB82_04945 [Limnothrix sp.]